MPRVKKFDENEVLLKAMSLFWKQGYSATSVQDLVEHLGINRASLYDTFGDKEQLFQKSFEQYRRINIDSLSKFLAKHSNVKMGFRGLFEKAMDEALHDSERKGCFVVNTTTELIPGDENIEDILDRNKRDITGIFIDYLQKGKESGQIKGDKDINALAGLFYTVYNGLRVVSKVRPNKEELLATINLTMSLLS
jgi:TetR/AcrR family transcriptional repressor of nem operon